jgi:hypothetical protein
MLYQMLYRRIGPLSAVYAQFRNASAKTHSLSRRGPRLSSDPRQALTAGSGALIRLLMVRPQARVGGLVVVLLIAKRVRSTEAQTGDGTSNE